MTAYHNDTTGLALYAKPLPIVASPWGTDAVNLNETGTTGWYSFSNTSTVDYAIYKQLGGSKASSDTVVGSVAVGGESTVTVVPLTGVVESRVDGTSIAVFTSETVTISIAVIDAEGDAIDVSAMTLTLVIENSTKTDISVIANGSITKVSSTISFAVPSAVSTNEGMYRWALRKTGDAAVLMTGPFIVTYAPTAD